MSSKTALVLGANAGQADLIRYLGEHGWSVTACAHRPGGAGARIADHFEQVDITDVEGVTALAKRLDAGLVYSVSSDMAVPAVVEASRRLGLPHYFDDDMVDLFNSKPRLREHLNRHGLSVVAYRQIRAVEDAAGWTEFPCMVKPADSQGQRGVQKITAEADFLPAVELALSLSPTKTAIVEAYLEGVEISYNVLVVEGRVVVNEVSERLVHGDHLIGIPQGHLIPPVAVNEAAAAEGAALVEAVVASLGIQEGTLYFQMKVTPAGPKIIEIAPRLDGCHIWRLMKHSRDLDFLDLAVRRLVGEDVTAVVTGRPADGVYELMFQQTPPGTTFNRTDFLIPVDALHHEYRYEDGETILPINGRLEVVGYYVRKRTDV